jgi:hypothetical protein
MRLELAACCNKRTEFRYQRSWREKNIRSVMRSYGELRGAIVKAGLKSRDCCTQTNSELQAAW